MFTIIKLGQLSGSISKTVVESGTKIGQSAPVKSISSTAEAISEEIGSESSLNSQVSCFYFLSEVFHIFLIIFLSYSRYTKLQKF